jgi:hypothetical protein
MKKILMTLLALPAATFALEASAQSGYYAQGYGAQANVGMQNRIAGLEARLSAGVQAGAIDRREERNLRRQLNDLRRMEMSYSQNGLSRDERNMLQQRTRTVREQLRMAGGNGWANRYGWNDSDFDRYGNAYGNSYGTVTYDRYGNPVASGYPNGVGGPYEPAYNSSRGLNIGDVITGLLGGNTLRQLPSGYQTQYRDRSDVYFRSDGNRVYEIDARTNRVIRVHPMR